MTPTSPAAQQVGVALVIHHGAVLIGIRGPDGALPGYHEFPGGKCRPDEPPATCAVRECLEETGLAVRCAGLVDRQRHSYAHATVELSFFHCEAIEASSNDSLPMVNEPWRWTPLAKLGDLNFPAANQRVVELLENWDSRQGRSISGR